MRTLTRTSMVAAAVVVSIMQSLPVQATVQERDPPGNLAIWIFLGFCALIVVAQLVPLAMRLFRKTPRLVPAEEAKLKPEDRTL